MQLILSLMINKGVSNMIKLNKSKLLLSAIMVITICLSVGCSTKTSDNANAAGMANPWTNSTSEEILQTIGVDMPTPQGAIDVDYQKNDSIGLAQMSFKLSEYPDIDFNYRIQTTSAFEDISGMYYEWNLEETAKIGWCEGKIYRAISDDQTVDLLLWYDVVPGIMYSLSASAPDLDGFDLQAIAEMLYVPMQTDAE